MIEPEAEAIERIQNNGNHPVEWLEFLTQCQTHTPGIGDERYRHLVYLYGRAVNLISAEENRKNISYAKLLVNFAQLQMRFSEDEARSTFQLARNNAKHFALVYVAWAQFELSTGNKDKCRSLLRKGKDFGAQPLELLRRAFDNLIEGKNDLLEKHKSSESSMDSSPFSTGEESSSGVTDTGISTVDNTSDVISFKLPSNSSRQQFNCIRSNSSSSDETDTLPLVPTSASQPYYWNRCSMSTQKPLIKSTPDFRSGAKSLAGCMNLSVRRKKTRRVLEGTGGAFGLPMRVKVAVQEVEETGNELEGINELEATVHDSIVEHGNEKIASVGHDDRQANRNKQAHDVIEPDDPKDELRGTVTAPESEQNTVNKMFRDENPSDGKKENPELKRENCAQNVAPCTVQEQHSHTNTSGVFLSGLTSQKSGYSGQLNVCSGQLSAGGVVPGYPPGKQFLNSSLVVPQAPQETFVVNGHVYLKLETIGRGGSSKVFRAFDGKRICAIKYVNLEEADDVIVQSYVNEISLLKRLQGNDNIIKLFDWELNLETNTIVIVMECGSIDLAGFLRKHRVKISQGELQGYWRQMLEAVHVTHEQGIIHSDLKPANFLLVEGRLKLIDFGIANALQGDKTSIERETQVGTLNFMSPEAFQDISHAPRVDSAGNPKPKMKIGRASDVWSLGCILYMMVYGKTPFQHITNHIAKLQCIIDPSHAIEFPDVKNRYLLDVIKGCLRRVPRERYTIPQLLEHPFLTSPSLDEDKLFDCLMEFAKVDVNSPRSIRAVSKSLCEQLLSGGKIEIAPNVPRPLQVVHSQNSIPPVQDPGRPGHHSLLGVDTQRVLKPPIGSGNAKYMKRRVNQQNKENSHLDTVLST